MYCYPAKNKFHGIFILNADPGSGCNESLLDSLGTRVKMRIWVVERYEY